MEGFFKKKALFSNRPKGSPGGPSTATAATEQHLAILDTSGIAVGVAGSWAPPAESPREAGPAALPHMVDGFVICNNNCPVRKPQLGGRGLNRSSSQLRPGSRPRSTQQVALAAPRRLRPCQGCPGWPRAALGRSTDRLGSHLGRFEKVLSFFKKTLH